MKIKKKRMLTAIGAGAAAVGLVFAGASAAQALSYTTVSTGATTFKVQATSTSTTLPNGDYRVGVCTVDDIGWPVAFAPACGGFSEDITIDDSSPSRQIVNALTANLPKSGANISNNHFPWIPGQGSTFTCDEDTECVVVIAEHSGVSHTIVPGETSPITFPIP